MIPEPPAVRTPAPVRMGAQRTLLAVQVVVAVIVALTNGAGGLYTSCHVWGGFVGVELRTVAPIYDTRTPALH